MKKIIALLSFFLILVFNSFSLYAQTIKFGIMGGVNVAEITNYNSFTDTNNRSGAVFGFFAEIPIIGNAFSVRPELFYSQEGLNYISHPTDIPPVNNKLKLGYLKFPVFLKYSFVPNSLLSPNIYAGPYIAVNISAKKVSSTTKAIFDVRSSKKPIDAGFIGGIGIDVAIFEVGLRYSLGLVDIDKNAPRQRNNRVLSAVLGIKF